jgi:hypothetical protein
MMRGVFTMEGLNIRYAGGRRYLEGWEAVATFQNFEGFKLTISEPELNPSALNRCIQLAGAALKSV